MSISCFLSDGQYSPPYFEYPHFPTVTREIFTIQQDLPRLKSKFPQDHRILAMVQLLVLAVLSQDNKDMKFRFRVLVTGLGTGWNTRILFGSNRAATPFRLGTTRPIRPLPWHMEIELTLVEAWQLFGMFKLRHETRTASGYG